MLRVKSVRQTAVGEGWGGGLNPARERETDIATKHKEHP